MSTTRGDHRSAGEATPGKPKPLWRNLDYMLLWSGQVVSTTGTQASQLAFPLLILALTSSPAQAGFAGALRALPCVIFALPAGTLIDRWDRKRVMMLCDSGRALSMASIPVALMLGHLTVLHLYLVALIEGTLFVFFNIAEVACLPQVVAKEQLPVATAQNMVTDGISSLIGPSLGGALYAVGQFLPFLSDAASYAASVGSLFFIRTRFQKERTVARRTLRVEMREGLGWLWHHPLIRFMALYTGGNNLISAGYILIIIVLAQQQHASSLAIGLILTAGGSGSILGAIVAPHLQRRLSFGQGIIGTSWLFALCMMLYVVAPNPFVLGIISAATFSVGPLYNVVAVSYRLALIPDELQGRVNSVYRLAAFGGQPLGLALMGVFIQNMGVIQTIVICSLGLTILAVTATLNTHVRTAPPLAEVQAE